MVGASAFGEVRHQSDQWHLPRSVNVVVSEWLEVVERYWRALSCGAGAMKSGALVGDEDCLCLFVLCHICSVAAAVAAVVEIGSGGHELLELRYGNRARVGVLY